jgi:hypothetical protein
MSDEAETEEHWDPTEILRLVILGIGVGMNAWIMWDYLKEKPEVMIWQGRARDWWRHNVTDARKRAREWRVSRGRMIFEAHEVVEEQP